MNDSIKGVIGQGFFETGYVYAPYMPVYTSPIPANVKFNGPFPTKFYRLDKGMKAEAIMKSALQAHGNPEVVQDFEEI
jgi:hypothetical protein